MPITSYSELKTEIASFAHRDDLTSSLDTFIDLAEADMQVRSKLLEFEATGTISITSGSGSLPSGFLGFVSVYVDNSPNRQLRFLPPSRFDAMVNDYGSGTYYTIKGTTIHVDFSSGNVSCTYRAKFTPLSDSNTSNAILASFPDVYLFGCLKQVAIWSHDTEQTERWAGLFNEAIARLKRYNVDRKFGPELAVKVA